MSFVKLDRGLLSSSLWIEGDADTVRVWVYLLLAADAHGLITETQPAIAHACKLPVERTEDILAGFARPDRHSRTPVEDGRRVEIIREPEWGIHLVNYAKYRARRDPEERRKQVREAVRRLRARRNPDVSHGKPRKAQEEGRREKVEEEEQRIAATSPPPVPPSKRPAKAPNGNGALKTTPQTPSWSAEASKLWIDHFHGTAPGARIGAALKPLVAAHGWPAVRDGWCNYLRQAEAEYASPQRFAATFGRWSGTASPTAPKSKAQQQEDRNREVLQRFVKGGDE